MATSRKTIIDAGRLNTYLLSAYAARRLGISVRGEIAALDRSLSETLSKLQAVETVVARQTQAVDQGQAALIKDLRRRGLLDETLVLRGTRKVAEQLAAEGVRVLALFVEAAVIGEQRDEVAQVPEGCAADDDGQGTSLSSTR